MSKLKIFLLILLTAIISAASGLYAGLFANNYKRPNDKGPTVVFNSMLLLRSFDVNGFDMIYPEFIIAINSKGYGGTDMRATPANMMIKIEGDSVTFIHGNGKPAIFDWKTPLGEYEKNPQPQPNPMEIDVEGEDFKARFYVEQLSVREKKNGDRHLATIRGMLLIDFDSPPDSQSGSAY